MNLITGDANVLPIQLIKVKLVTMPFTDLMQPSDIVAKLERIYSLDEQILRYLTFTLDNDALEQLEKNKSLSTVLKEEVVAETVEVKTETENADTNNKDNDN